MTAVRRARPCAPVVCVVDETRRDLAVAAAAVAGRFTHNAVTLDLGPEPDWIAGGLAGDVEWRTEWVKANEGLDLAHAYASTGDDRFLLTWERLVSSYATQVPVGHDRSEVSARRMQNWLYAWQRFREAGAATADRSTCSPPGSVPTPPTSPPTSPPSATTARWSCTPCCSSGSPSTTGDAAQRALDDLAANARRDILPDGVQRERSQRLPHDRPALARRCRRQRSGRRARGAR